MVFEKQINNSEKLRPKLNSLTSDVRLSNLDIAYAGEWCFLMFIIRTKNKDIELIEQMAKEKTIKLQKTSEKPNFLY